jgi:four helix bundle protein
MHDFKGFTVWKKSMKSAKTVYVNSSAFPKDEYFELISQIKRSVITMLSNIAEGDGRNSDKEFLRFLSISPGSWFEPETRLLPAADLYFIENEKLNPTRDDVTGPRKMPYRFCRRLELKVNAQSKS